MDYSKGLKALRASADDFDYDRYLKDVEAGKFKTKTVSAKEMSQEGLMRRKEQALETPEMDEPLMDGLSHRFLEIRNRRRAGGWMAGVEEGLRGAVAEKGAKKAPEPKGGVEGMTAAQRGEGLMRPKARPPVRPEARPWEESDDFVSKLYQSESSGRSDAEITTSDGRTFVGKGQFGDARLTDYMNATKTKFTQAEFKADEALQDKVMAWHIRDLDKQISRTKGSENFSRDGLRAVAHLGGVGGMRQFVASGGNHNPSDDLGTSLNDYYNKFKG